jgi:hypothetical protein
LNSSDSERRKKFTVKFNFAIGLSGGLTSLSRSGKNL